MIEKLKHFWNAFWYSLKTAYNKAFKEPPKELTQNYRDTEKINFLSIFISKLNSLVNTEATFDIESDSMITEPLNELIKDIESKRFEITADMLGDGDLWVFPATDSTGKLYHRYVTQDEVRILNTDGEKVVDLIGIIDKYTTNDNKIYLLNRRHTLNGNTLTIETFVTDGEYNRVFFDEWAKYESVWSFNGVDNIGVGRFKSPTSSRGKSAIYGVPLNYGCKEIEEKSFNDLNEIEIELKNNKSILFADPLILRKKVDTMKIDGKRVTSDGYEIPENLFPIDTRGGNSGANIDIFSPSYRFEQLYFKLEKDLADYERQVGTGKGFLTEHMPSNTATETKVINASTIALIGQIQNSLDIGIESVIKADCIFLNIPEDLYNIKIDWYDVFADTDAQYNRIKEASKDGFAEAVDVMQWLFPNMSIQELEDKLERIKEEKQQNLADFNLANINGTEENAENPFKQKDNEQNEKDTENPTEDDEKKKK